MKKHFYVFILIVFSCSKEPPPEVITTVKGYDAYPNADIYVDTSKYNNFELQFVYEPRTDSIAWLSWEEAVKNTPKSRIEKSTMFLRIQKLDTLAFLVDDHGFSLPRGYNYVGDSADKTKSLISIEQKPNGVLKNKTGFGIPDYLIRNNISVPLSNDVEIILKKNNKIIENYIVDITKAKGKYILNPLSKSKYKIDTVQYGGLNLYGFKSKYISGKFNYVEGIDYWFEKPPESITLRSHQLYAKKTVLVRRN